MKGETIREVIKYWMEGEINNLIQVWLSVVLSLCYCFVLGKIVPKGTPRFLTILPVVCLFLVLPLFLHSMNFGGNTAFFIAWLANFKLLMFAFGKGPLSDSSLTLPRFAAVACLPIKTQSSSTPLKSVNSHPNIVRKDGHKSLLSYVIKGVLVALLLKVYAYSEYIHPKVILFLYCFHIYFVLEITLAVAGALARAIFGVELEPQFNDPYLSTSLQEFWGRRWNLVVTGVLRPTVYEPVLHISTLFIGRKFAPFPAVLSTFLVSGLMHELMFYYLGRMRSTGEISWFFLLHGVCVMAEIAAKKAFAGKFRLPGIVTTPLTVLFVLGTSFWLFFPQLLASKVDVRGIEEYALVGVFLKDIGQALAFKSST